MKRKTFLTGVLLIGILGLTSCGSSSSTTESIYDAGDYSSSTNYSTSDYYEDYDAAESYDGESSAFGDDADYSDSDSTKSYATDRKLIKNVNITAETTDFDSFITKIETDVTQYDGYIENSYTYNGSNYSYSRSLRYANITIRIPQDKLDSFISSFSSICNIVNKSESVTDVTLTYVDIKSHKEALEAEEERLLELIDEAYDMNDILTIENELSNVRYQIESMESQLRTYDNQVNYSTVYIDIDEVEEVTVVPEVKETVGEKIINGFTSSLKGVGEGIVNFFIWFISALPYLAIWGGIIFGIVRLIIFIVRKSKKKKAMKRANIPPVMPAAPGMPQPMQMNPGMPQPVQMNPGMPQPAQMNPGMPQPAQMNPKMPQPEKINPEMPEQSKTPGGEK